MRFSNALVAGVVAAGLAALAGCSAPSGPSGTSGTSGSSVSPSATAPAGGGAASASRAPAAAPATVAPGMRAGARAAAVQFYGLYTATRFADSWDLLVPAAKREIPKSVWVSVHNACPSAGAGAPRVIRAVTVFGSAAIVTAEIAGAPSKQGTAQDVFNYTNGQWRYSPEDLSTYRHGSVAADVAAAKSAGLCAGWKSF